MDEEELALLEQMREVEKWVSLKFMMDADILIHDSQYTPEDYDKKRGWGHSCYLDTVDCAIDARVKELYLFHLDPNYTDEVVDQLHANALKRIEERGADLKCFVAREGMSIPLMDAE